MFGSVTCRVSCAIAVVVTKEKDIATATRQEVSPTRKPIRFQVTWSDLHNPLSKTSTSGRPWSRRHGMWFWFRSSLSNFASRAKTFGKIKIARNKRAIVTCNAVGRASDIECLFLRSASCLSSYHLHRQHPTWLRDRGQIFFFSSSTSGNFFVFLSPKSCTKKSEEATRQQGGLFFRENSSNGGKAIRTFWRNTKFGKIPCQGQNWRVVSLW